MNKIANISSDASCNEIGRIGGNIPACLLKNIDSFKHYKFFLMVQNPSASNEYLSIFVPESYDIMVDNNIYPNCSLKVFVHSFSEESDMTTILWKEFVSVLLRNLKRSRTRVWLYYKR